MRVVFLLSVYLPCAWYSGQMKQVLSTLLALLQTAENQAESIQALVKQYVETHSAWSLLLLDLQQGNSSVPVLYFG